MDGLERDRPGDAREVGTPSQDAATITANSSHRTRGRLDREITTGPSRAFPVHHADSPVDGVAHDTQGCWPQGLPGVTIPVMRDPVARRRSDSMEGGSVLGTILAGGILLFLEA